MAEHGPGAASSFPQQRTEPSPSSCQKGKVSNKDRGFATLTHHESVFNVTTAIPEGGWFAPGNPPQPLAHGGTPHSTGHGEDSGTLTQSVPTRPLLQVPFLAEKKALGAPRPQATGQCDTVEKTCPQPRKRKRVERQQEHEQSRDLLLQGPTSVRQPSKARWEKSAKPTVFGQEQGSITRVYRIIRPQPEKKKQGELSRRYTPENSPMRHVQRSTERQGKKEVKKDQSVTETNKIKILFKKN